MMNFGPIPPQLDLSEIDHQDGGIVEDSFLEDHHPVGFSSSTSDSLVFLLRGTEHWYEWTKSFFYMEGVIEGESTERVEGANSPFKAGGNDQNFKVVQNFWHSLFSKVDTEVNDTSLSFNNENYPYVAYIQNLFNLSTDQQKTSGILHGWGTEAERKDQIYNNQKMCGLFQLKTPLLLCEKNLISFCNVKITLNRVANPAFYFDWGETKDDKGYKFRITKAVFKVRKNKIKDSYWQYWEQKLNDGGMIRYNLKDCRIFTRTLAGVPSEIIEDNLCHNILHTKLFFGFVDSDAFMGKKMHPLSLSLMSVQKFEKWVFL